MDYTLQPAVAERHEGRVVPPRVRNLRCGGGRKDTPGWTEQKRRGNRDRFDSLRPFIKTGVTIVYPPTATPEQLQGFNESVREFCKEKGIAARSVWEGPGRHQHIALDIEHEPGLERAWKSRLEKRWLKIFEDPMPANAFHWNPDVAPEHIASYLSKTRGKNGAVVKGAWPWLSFNPIWEVGFRKHSQPSEKQREKIGAQYSAEKEGNAHREPRKNRGYHQFPQTSEKEGEDGRSECPVCWTRHGRSLWRRSCICTGSVPLKIHDLPAFR